MTAPPPIAHGPPTLARLDAATATPAFVQALRVGAVLAPADVGVITLVGPGAVDCVQGLLTSDLEKSGDGGFVYGALLTPKGMIIVDGWAARQGAEVRFTTPAPADALGLFTRSVPPRLARVADRSADYTVLRLAGLRALAIAQEARFDEIGGVSYTKGCYTGQETVSRLHFRGHANRQLRGIEFDTEPSTVGEAPPLVVHQDHEVGRVSSVVWLAESAPGAPLVGRWVGLALLRREVTSGTMVRAAGVDARVVELPFPLPRLEPA